MCTAFGELHTENGEPATDENQPTFRLLACFEAARFAELMIDSCPKEQLQSLMVQAFGPSVMNRP